MVQRVRRLVSLSVLALLARTSFADPSDADTLSDEATALGKRGDFLGAAKRFHAAYRADPRPELICNIGIAYHKAGGQLTRAQFLSQCLTRGTSLDPTFIDAVRKVLVNVEGKLRAGAFTPIDVVVAPDGASVLIDDYDAEDAFVGSRLIWLAFGSHKITVRAETYVDQTREVEAASSTQRTMRVVLEHAPIHEPPLLDPARPPSDTIPVRARATRLPIATSVAAIVLGAAAGGAYLIARGRASDASFAATHGPSEAAYNDDVSSARRWQYVSWGLGLTAVVAAGASAFLWYRAATLTQIDIRPSSSGAAVTFRGAF